MGQMDSTLGVHKGIRQAAALIVDQNKGGFIGAEVHRQGQNIGNDKFRFTGTGGTGHQAVGTLVLFVQVQGKQIAVRAPANGNRQGFHRVVPLPSG